VALRKIFESLLGNIPSICDVDSDIAGLHFMAEIDFLSEKT